jgi:hypothetical protein
MFESLLHGINSKLLQAEVSVAPPKLPYRALEKMAMEKSEHGWTARCVLDLARGAINCANTGDMDKALQYLDACTDEVQCSNIFKGLVADLPKIKVVRMKNRFSRPTCSGWADICINFFFTEDRNKHVHELQIQHSTLVHVRKKLGEDSHYAGLRGLAELLQTTEPTEEEEARD